MEVPPAVPHRSAGPTTNFRTAPDGNVLQQLVRSRASDGTESLHGWLRVPLAANQRTAAVHVAFCPPFAAAPRVDVEQREGPAARIKPAQVLPYGARFDLKLAEPTEISTFILLELSAETKPATAPPDGPMSEQAKRPSA